MNSKLSFFLKIFIVLTLLTTTMLLASGVLFSHMIQNTSENQIGEMQMENTRSLTDGMGQISEGLKRDAIHFSLLLNEYNLSKLDLYDTLPTYEAVSILKDIQDKLSFIVRSNLNLYSAYLYLEKDGIVVSSQAGSYDVADFLDTEWLKYCDDMSVNNYEKWILPRVVHSSSSVNSQDPGVLVVSYLFRLSSYTTPNADGIIVLNVCEQDISEILNEVTANEQERAIAISEDGVVISDLIKSNIGTNVLDNPYIEKIIGSDKDSGYFFEDIQGARTVVSFSKINYNDWILVKYSLLDNLNTKIKNNVRNLALMLVGILVLGIISSYLLSKYLYSPVKQIMDELMQESRIDVASSGDLVLLKRAIKNLMQEERTLRESLEKNLVSQDEEYLRGMLSDGFSNQEPSDSLRERFESTGNLCIYLSEDKAISKLGTKNAQDKFYYRNLIISIFCEMIQEKSSLVSGIIYNSEIVLFVHCNLPPEDEPRKDFIKQLERFSEYLYNNLDISATVGVSYAFEGLMGMQEAYRQAFNAARRKLFNGYGSVITASEVPEEDAYFYPQKEEKKIINAFESGDYETTDQSLTEFFDVLRVIENLSVDNALLILHRLTDSLLSVLAKFNTQYCAQIIQTDKLLSSSYSFPHNTLEDIEESLQEQMKSIIQDIISVSDSSEDLSEKMMDYILNNYNRDISIDEISIYLGISYSYTRKLFKEKTGTSILDYINEIRIDKSKDLLLKTDHTYKEIAEMLGYNNEQSYVRYFKKYMCITPNSFRKRQRNLLNGKNSYHN